jgi:hypothetical protein
MDFNYQRNIPNLQEPWMHTERVVLPLRLTPHTHRVFCRFGVRPSCHESIVAVHKTKTHNVFIVREKNLNSIKGLLPPSHRDGDFD